MSQHPPFSSEWFAEHREHLGWWKHGNERRILDYLAELQAEVQQLLDAQQDKPSKVTVTTSNQGEPVSSFAPGAPITFTAATDNAEGQPLATDANGQPFTYTWTASAGTIVPGPDTTTITISDAPLGDVTATATGTLGLPPGSVTATVADQTPASVSVTAS